MKDIELKKSTITEIAMKPANAGVASKIKIVSIMTAEIAGVLGARRLLFDTDQATKAGYTAIELDFELVNVRVKFESAKLDKSLEMDVEKASQFKVYRKGPRNKSKRLMVSFRLHYAGSPFELLEYLLRVGGIEGVCTLQPRQGELPLAEAEKKPEVLSWSSGRHHSAQVLVKESADAYVVTYRASLKGKTFRSKEPMPYASEAQAREHGLRMIRDWADSIIAKGKLADRKAAQKLSDWCSERLPAQQSLTE